MTKFAQMEERNTWLVHESNLFVVEGARVLVKLAACTSKHQLSASEWVDTQAQIHGHLAVIDVQVELHVVGRRLFIVTVKAKEM